MDYAEFNKEFLKAFKEFNLESKRPTTEDPVDTIVGIVEEIHKPPSMASNLKEGIYNLMKTKEEDPVDTIVGIVEEIHKPPSMASNLKEGIYNLMKTKEEDPVETVVGIIEKIHSEGLFSNIKIPKLPSWPKKTEDPDPVETIVNIIEELTPLYPDNVGKNQKPIAVFNNSDNKEEIIYADGTSNKVTP